MNDVTRSVKPEAGEPAPAPREDGRKKRWRAHREARRQTMIDAAVTAIHRYGTNIGMEDIAAEAGVSKPVLYRHFADQADLYVAVGQHAAEALLVALTPELDNEREPREHVAAVIDAYLRYIESEPELYRFVIRRSFAGGPVENDPVADYSSLIANRLTRVFGEKLREAGLDSGGAEPWARGIVGMVQSAGDWWLDRRSMSRESLTEYLTTLLWDGFSGIVATGVRPADGGTGPRTQPLRLVGLPPSDEA